MGLFDKAKEKIKDSVPKSFGEETLGTFDSDSTDYQDQLSSAFSIDESETRFMVEHEETQKKNKKESQDIHIPEVNDNPAEDILVTLRIPPTFELDSDIFLPEDLVDIDFSTQAPYGYDMGEVQAFLERTKVSVKRYVKLLRQRNEHVARLATVIDRLQVDLNNIKFEREIANGINVMPTQSTDALESELMTARLYIKRLEDEINNSGNKPLSNAEREKFDALQDNLSIAQREIEERDNEISILKSQIASMIEDNSKDKELYKNVNDSKVSESFSLPDDEDDLSLPEIESNKDSINVDDIKPITNSAFSIDDDDESFISFMGDSDGAPKLTYLDDEEDDDEIEKLMKDWNN